VFHHAPVLVLVLGIGIGQYHWVLGALLGIVLTLSKNAVHGVDMVIQAAK